MKTLRVLLAVLGLAAVCCPPSVYGDRRDLRAKMDVRYIEQALQAFVPRKEGPRLEQQTGSMGDGLFDCATFRSPGGFISLEFTGSVTLTGIANHENAAHYLSPVVGSCGHLAWYGLLAAVFVRLPSRRQGQDGR
jgi:hypothetical protein